MNIKILMLKVYLMDAYESWIDEVWNADPDAYYCCNGRDCACGAFSNKENWEFTKNKTK